MNQGIQHELVSRAGFFEVETLRANTSGQSTGSRRLAGGSGSEALDGSVKVLLMQFSGDTDSMRDVFVSEGHEVYFSLEPDDGCRLVLELDVDVVVVDQGHGSEEALEFLCQLKQVRHHCDFSLILLTMNDEREMAIRALDLGVDDYVRKPIEHQELAAMVCAKVDQPSVSADRRSVTQVLNPVVLKDELAREIRRAARTTRIGCIGAIDLAERESLSSRLGLSADRDLRVQLVALSATKIGDFDLISMTEAGQLLILMPDSDPLEAKNRLLQISEHLAKRSLLCTGESVKVTPVSGFTTFDSSSPDPEVLVGRALAATAAATTHLDLQPVEWDKSFDETLAEPTTSRGAELRRRLRTPLQIFITLDIGIFLPFVAYVLFDRIGFSIAPAIYFVVVLALLVTAALIWIEGFLALDPKRPAPLKPGPHPPATAIIAAYLPNEASTLLQTIEAFLKIDYPGTLQVILAYNTPRSMPIESDLREIAANDPRFVPYKVLSSTSKAQNVNAALAEVTGEIVGVFDADHHPEPDCFRRAWRWLSGGYDVVQGHCVIRNGDNSFVSRMVAVEFESIYAVSHPGRAELHKFGIFGGSNGYWRTEVLRYVRMHGFMLTEDIDSSLRVVEAGGSIASDPALMSRELAPVTLKALWNQRMRWAQGWYQVSLKHLMPSLRSPALTIRQKLGFAFLLGWRELYPWISLQILPLLAFFAYKADSFGDTQLLIPIFVLSTLFTLSVGPGQTYFAYRLGAPEIRRHRVWFVLYMFFSSIFYAEMKNIIGRVAQVKEFTSDRQWKVTPRVTETETALQESGTR